MSTESKEQSGKGLGIVVALTTTIALVLIGALVYFTLFQGVANAELKDQSNFVAASVIEDAAAPGYTIYLDTSAYPGAVQAQAKVFTEFGLPVEYLPFATLDGMRFTGWYTGPADNINAVRVDNNSLYLLEMDTNQTLYARFEPRPTSTDYSDQGLPILMYHYFYDRDLGENGEDANWMDIHLFESHLAYLQSQNYYYPTWEEAVAYIRGEIVLPQPSIMLTSDDGHESFFRLAMPLVFQYNAKMTSFIILSGYQSEMYADIDQSRIFIQSHSFSMHEGGYDGDARILTASYEDIYNDAVTCGQILGNTLVYCYPFGKTNTLARQALSDAGVGVALVIEHDTAYPLCDPMAVPRLRMNDGSDVDFLISIL